MPAPDEADDPPDLRGFGEIESEDDNAGDFAPPRPRPTVSRPTGSIASVE